MVSWSPVGTIEIPLSNIQSSLRDSTNLMRLIPNTKVLGYFQMSLRDNSSLACYGAGISIGLPTKTVGASKRRSVAFNLGTSSVKNLFASESVVRKRVCKTL